MGMDGAYYLCKEKKFWPFPNPGGDRCLVYSFGIGGNFNFDDAIAKAGCEVHAFDPSKYICFNPINIILCLIKWLNLSKKGSRKTFLNLMSSLKIYQPWEYKLTKAFFM